MAEETDLFWRCPVCGQLVTVQSETHTHAAKFGCVKVLPDGWERGDMHSNIRTSTYRRTGKEEVFEVPHFPSSKAQFFVPIACPFCRDGIPREKVKGHMLHDYGGYFVHCADYDDECRHNGEPLGFFVFAWLPHRRRNGRWSWLRFWKSTMTGLTRAVIERTERSKTSDRSKKD